MDVKKLKRSASWPTLQNNKCIFCLNGAVHSKVDSKESDITQHDIVEIESHSSSEEDQDDNEMCSICYSRNPDHHCYAR